LKNTGPKIPPQDSQVAKHPTDNRLVQILAMKRSSTTLHQLQTSLSGHDNRWGVKGGCARSKQLVVCVCVLAHFKIKVLPAFWKRLKKPQSDKINRRFVFRSCRFAKPNTDSTRDLYTGGTRFTFRPTAQHIQQPRKLLSQ
jgi:hypothetical protein